MADTGKGRVLVFAYGLSSAGVPGTWLATGSRAGVNWLPGLSDETTDEVVEHIRAGTQPGDIVIVSVHWGSNWGYDVTSDERRFAHRLIDEAGVAVIHGHSTHHAKQIEVYEGRLVNRGSGEYKGYLLDRSEWPEGLG